VGFGDRCIILEIVDLSIYFSIYIYIDTHSTGGTTTA
jgi:hypothetical protein